jgi:hypothetical protein
MIQRIQTVYLALASISAGLTFFFPLALFKSSGIEKYSYTILQLLEVETGEIISPGNGWVHAAVLMASAVLSFGTIFLFNNRKRQLQLGQVNYILLLAVIIGVYFSVKTLVNFPPLNQFEDIGAVYWIGFYLPVAALAFQFLANRSIKKDDKLVKSVERLRG